MRMIAIVGLIGSIAAASLPRFGTQQAGQLPCLTPDSMGLLRIADLKHHVVASDSGSILYRNGFGIAGVDTGMVRVVSDTLVCTRITQAVDSAFSSPLAPTPYLVVVRAGPRYVAFGMSGSSYYFLDTTFVVKDVVP